MLSGVERARRTPLPFAFWAIGQERPNGQGFSGWEDAGAVDVRTERGVGVELAASSKGQPRRGGCFGEPRRALWAEGRAHAEEAFVLGAG